jgi:hypothetical protein
MNGGEKKKEKGEEMQDEQIKQTPGHVIRERTIPTEPPPLVGEI